MAFPGTLTLRLLLAASLFAPAVPVFSGAPALPLKPKKWTVIVYINGKSNLEGNSFDRINNLECAGSDSNVNIVAEYSRLHSAGDGFTRDGDWGGSRRYYITRDADSGHIASPVLQQNDSVDSGDWRHVADFIKWAKTNFPAERYILLYRFHGGGWIDPSRNKAMNYDNETRTFTSTAEMARIFQEAGPVDLYLSDVCMMQSLEVLYGIKDYVKVAVGAEDLSYGFNYYASLSLIKARPAVTTEAVAKKFIADYAAQPGLNGLDYQLSAVNTSALGDMATELGRWSAAVMRVDDKAAVLAAKRGVARSEQPQYADLKLFAQILADRLDMRRPGAAELIAETRALLEVLNNRLLLDNAGGGAIGAGLGGVTVYVPPVDIDGYVAQHSALEFANSSGWTKFALYLNRIN
ncbi:MAG: clostripain-related cysteine peptidase [Elusimicrobiota bacterium]